MTPVRFAVCGRAVGRVIRGDDVDVYTCSSLRTCAPDKPVPALIMPRKNQLAPAVVDPENVIDVTLRVQYGIVSVI